MPGISIHVVDVSRGVVAAGMRVEVFRGEQLIASGRITAKGVLDSEPLGAKVAPGAFEAVFYVAEWFREQRVAIPSVPFLDVVRYRFGVADPDQHYHLPFKCTPWGYSCFRGGA